MFIRCQDRRPLLASIVLSYLLCYRMPVASSTSLWIFKLRLMPATWILQSSLRLGLRLPFWITKFYQVVTMFIVVTEEKIKESKENLHFYVQSYKLFSFLSSSCFLKEIENMYSVSLSSYRNTRESLGELEKAVETIACGSCSHSISHSPKLSRVFL